MRPTMKRVLWFITFWVLGVGTLAAVALVIRLFL